MRVLFLGVRGSTPAPGSEFVHYGGHTSCVAVAHDDAVAPTLVLDAGTGIRLLSDRLPGRDFSGVILLTHLHWDHVQGLPFFGKGDQPTSDIDVYLPAQDGLGGRDQLARFLAPPAFPILPEGLQGHWRFHAINPGLLELDGFHVSAFEVEHKGGRTFGYRVTDVSGSIAYVPDHAAVSRPASLAGFLRDVDLLIHDAQFLDVEREVAARFGHSTVTDSIELGVDVGARHVVLFHHAPARTDAEMESMERGIEGPMPVTVAREGMTLTVGTRD
ncbi:MBL fold metallo-hydrolase [Intrasporangium sp.]|uniref:MBL fold metallo-hydrolase n=1 Tax=Intrasporangium sp. TaxID=1925024 RepID=UPI00293AC83F|nr:MBL fold metallo-hydrolase [Intrasporangium sp.]MDV3222069.1 MBL fold metallo-hydrolase [Intrasporangium sp.]